MFLVLASLPWTLLAMFWLHSRSLNRLRADHDHRIDTLISAQQSQIEGLVAQKNPDLEQLISLVDRLCQRVQAPAKAVNEHAEAVAGPIWAPPAVNPESDQEYWESKEALAERLAREEITSGVGA